MNDNSFKDTKTGFKLRQIKHKLTLKYKYPRMLTANKRYKACVDKKSKKQIRREIAISKKFWGCYPLHYFRYDLYKIDRRLTKEQLINYIPDFFFYNLFLSYYDGDKYSILLRDKNITEQLFRSVGIEQPHTICKLINGKMFSQDLKEVNFHEINSKLKERKCKKIFIKPIDGQGGYGIIIFHLSENDEYTDKDDLKLSETFLLNLSQGNDYIIQSGIIQDESIMSIYESSVNTFRIATENKKGSVRVVCSVLRMGRQGNEVDNASQDGIVIGVDHSTGKCKDYAINENSEIFYKHPDTNFVFKNHKINNWDSIVNFTLKCAAKLPQFTYLGWDIALTEHGPIVIETNLEFGIDLYQIALGGLKEAFEISDPKKYWEK